MSLVYESLVYLYDWFINLCRKSSGKKNCLQENKVVLQLFTFFFHYFFQNVHRPPNNMMLFFNWNFECFEVHWKRNGLHNVTIYTAWPACQKEEWKVTVSLPSAPGQAGSALEYSKFYQLPSSPLALLVPGVPEEEIYKTVSSVSGYVGFLCFKRNLSWKYQKCKNPPTRPARVFWHKESDLVPAIILTALYIRLIKQKKKKESLKTACRICRKCYVNIHFLRFYFLLVFPFPPG